jgi:hypothetical protein
MTDDDPHADLKQHALTPEKIAAVNELRAAVPRKLWKRREQFVMVPLAWAERLAGAQGTTYTVALHVLHWDWKHRGEPFKLGNGWFRIGTSRYSKWRALTDLERRGLIAVERRPRKSPIVRRLI